MTAVFYVTVGAVTRPPISVPRRADDRSDTLRAYHRTCAFCFRLTPEVFHGLSIDDVSNRLRITPDEFRSHLESADDIMRSMNGDWTACAGV